MELNFFIAVLIIVVVWILYLRNKNKSRAQDQTVAADDNASTLDTSSAPVTSSSSPIGAQQDFAPVSVDDAILDIDDIPIERAVGTIDETTVDDPLQYMRVTVDSEVAPVALTYDAALVHRTLEHDRMDQRAKYAFSRRGSDYFRPIFEEEMSACEARDWWDNIAYPM